MKKQSNLSRLLDYSGRYRYFTFASWALSAISALMALIPFWYIWRIIDEVLRVAPDFSQAQNLVPVSYTHLDVYKRQRAPSGVLFVSMWVSMSKKPLAFRYSLASMDTLCFMMMFFCSSGRLRSKYL